MVQNIKKSYHKIANPNNPMPLSPFKKETRDTHTLTSTRLKSKIQEVILRIKNNMH